MIAVLGGHGKTGRAVAAALAERGVEVVDLGLHGTTPEKIRVRAGGAHGGVGVIDHRHRGVRGEAGDITLDVAVEQGVADDRQPEPGAHA